VVGERVDSQPRPSIWRPVYRLNRADTPTPSAIFWAERRRRTLFAPTMRFTDSTMWRTRWAAVGAAPGTSALRGRVVQSLRRSARRRQSRHGLRAAGSLRPSHRRLLLGRRAACRDHTFPSTVTMSFGSACGGQNLSAMRGLQDPHQVEYARRSADSARDRRRRL
jgi:hypothetical protein